MLLTVPVSAPVPARAPAPRVLNKNSALHLAAYQGRASLAAMLIRSGARSVPNSRGQYPIDLAIAQDNISVVAVLIKSGHFNVSSKRSDNRVPIVLAARSGHSRMVKALLSLKQSHLRPQESEKLKALYIAYSLEHHDITRILSKACPSYDAALMALDFDNAKNLAMIMDQLRVSGNEGVGDDYFVDHANSLNTLSVLLNRGLYLEKAASRAYEIAFGDDLTCHGFDAEGNVCAQHDDCGLVRLFVDLVMHGNLRWERFTRTPVTPDHMRFMAKHGRPMTLSNAKLPPRILMPYNPVLTPTLELQVKRWSAQRPDTPLHLCRNPLLVLRLIKKYNVNAIGVFGNTPLHCNASRPRVARMLLCQGADPNIENDFGELAMCAPVREFAQVVADDVRARHVGDIAELILSFVFDRRLIPF